jgi:hypothetical protein
MPLLRRYAFVLETIAPSLISRIQVNHLIESIWQRVHATR